MEIINFRKSGSLHFFYLCMNGIYFFKSVRLSLLQLHIKIISRVDVFVLRLELNVSQSCFHSFMRFLEFGKLLRLH